MFVTWYYISASVQLLRSPQRDMQKKIFNLVLTRCYLVPTRYYLVRFFLCMSLRGLADPAKGHVEKNFVISCARDAISFPRDAISCARDIFFYACPFAGSVHYSSSQIAIWNDQCLKIAYFHRTTKYNKTRTKASVQSTDSETLLTIVI